MIGRHPDRLEPEWRKMKREGTGRMTADITDRNVTLFQVWDPPQLPGQAAAAGHVPPDSPRQAVRRHAQGWD